MGIKRFHATSDNTITNAFDMTLKNRGTGSNMGDSDILEVFSIYGQETTSSVELSRVLIKFPITGSDSIGSSRDAGDIPASGSVSFYLRMFNARHSEQLPSKYRLNVLAVSQSWQEGTGLDMETYTDKTEDRFEGSNWLNANSSPKQTWKKVGGDYHTASVEDASVLYTQYFEKGFEDLDVEVTDLIEQWINGTGSSSTVGKENYGFGIFLTSSNEGYYSSSTGQDVSEHIHNPDGPKKSYYTKRFFSRSSEFFFKRPVIEARWDSRISDDRNNFHASSSMLSTADNKNNLYLYNYFRGKLTDIPHTETITVKLYTSSAGSPTGTALREFTATKHDTGVYRAEAYVATTASVIHDVWSGSVGGEYKTGSITLKKHSGLASNNFQQYITKITNLRPSYNQGENARFRVFTRTRDFDHTLYKVSTTKTEGVTIVSASYEILREVDGKVIFAHGTGSSDYHTYLSYDNSGSYFDFDTGMLESGYMYGIRFSYYTSDGWRDQKQIFKFRVENS